MAETLNKLAIEQFNHLARSHSSLYKMPCVAFAYAEPNPAYIFGNEGTLVFDLTFQDKPSTLVNLTTHIVNAFEERNRVVDNDSLYKFMIRGVIPLSHSCLSSGTFLFVSAGLSEKVPYLDDAMYDTDDLGNGILMEGLKLGLEPVWGTANYNFHGREMAGLRPFTQYEMKGFLDYVRARVNPPVLTFPLPTGANEIKTAPSSYLRKIIDGPRKPDPRIKTT